MLTCATCASRWDEQASPAVMRAFECPLCGGELVVSDRGATDDLEPVHADLGRMLREHLLGVGA